MNSPSPMSRPLPYNKEAEESVIGGMLLDSTMIDLVKRYLKPDDFWIRSYQIVCEAIYTLYDNGQQVDLVTVTDWLFEKNLMNNQNGQMHGVWASEITQAVASCFSLYYVEGHAKVVESHSLRRKIIAECEKTAREVYDAVEPDEVTHLIGSAAQAFAGMIATSEVKIRSVSDQTGRLLARMREAKQRGLPLFLPALNKKLGGGLYKGEVTVIGGMSGSGKTRLAVQIASALARQGHSVIYNSAELYLLDMQGLFVSHVCGLDNTQIRFGFNSSDDLELAPNGDRRYPYRRESIKDLERALERGEELLDGLPIWIYAPDYDPEKIIQERISLTPESIRANVIGHFQQRGRVDVLVIDFLGKLDFGDNRTHGEQAMRIKHAMNIFTRLAKELGIHIIIMHQMLESALKVRRPNYTHLEGAKEVYQLADNIMLVIAPHQHGEDCPKELREILIPKNRFGESGIIPELWYEGAVGYFGEASMSQMFGITLKSDKHKNEPVLEEVEF